MTRLPIFRGIQRNARTFRGKRSENAFSVTRTDWELYLEKFFMNEDRYYTEKEWRDIIRKITDESEMLKSCYRNISGMDYVGEPFSEMKRYDSASEKNDAEWPGQAGALRAIIVFYERFIMFACSLIGNDKVNMVLSRAA